MHSQQSNRPLVSHSHSAEARKLFWFNLPIEIPKNVLSIERHNKSLIAIIRHENKQEEYAILFRKPRTPKSQKGSNKDFLYYFKQVPPTIPIYYDDKERRYFIQVGDTKTRVYHTEAALMISKLVDKTTGEEVFLQKGDSIMRVQDCGDLLRERFREYDYLIFKNDHHIQAVLSSYSSYNQLSVSTKRKATQHEDELQHKRQRISAATLNSSDTSSSIRDVSFFSTNQPPPTTPVAGMNSHNHPHSITTANQNHSYQFTIPPVTYVQPASTHGIQNDTREMSSTTTTTVTNNQNSIVETHTQAVNQGDDSLNFNLPEDSDYLHFFFGTSNSALNPSDLQVTQPISDSSDNNIFDYQEDLDFLKRNSI